MNSPLQGFENHSRLPETPIHLSKSLLHLSKSLLHLAESLVHLSKSRPRPGHNV